MQGRNSIAAFFEYFGDMSMYALSLAKSSLLLRKRLRLVLIQTYQLGAAALPLVCLVALFTGVIIAFQTAYMLKRLSSEMYVASLVAVSLVRELGPVLTSLIVAGRSGSAVTAEISSMKASEQLDAFKSLATDPVNYVGVPRFWAFMIALPALIAYADVVGIFGGYLVSGGVFGMPFGLYARMSIEALTLKDVIVSLLKSLVFAAVIGVGATREGFASPGNAEGVGSSVIKSVVRNFIAILVADCLLTAICYVIL
jgi:phospholipid/cholesterol/gamma-HCH transport system permease protein